MPSVVNLQIKKNCETFFSYLFGLRFSKKYGKFPADHDFDNKVSTTVFMIRPQVTFYLLYISQSQSDPMTFL
jgi:hypothetical protein